MKLRKILATVAASALAVSAMAVSASAAITNENGTAIGEPGKYMFYAYDALGENAVNVYGVEIGCTYAADAAASGGGIAFLSDATWPGWIEWSNSADWGKAITITDGVLKYTSDTALFTDAGLVKDADNLGARVMLESWGLEMTVDSIKYLDKDGNVMEAVEAPAAEAKALAGSADVALYAQNNADWATATSAAVTVDKEGTYTVSLADLAIDPATLTVIYIKDTAVAAETATKSATGAINIKTDSVKINGTEMALTEGYNTTLTDAGAFDVAYFNMWATNYIDVSAIKEINTIDVTFTVTAAEDAAAAEEPTTEEDADDDAAIADDAAPADEFEAPVVENGTYTYAPSEESSDWGSQGFLDYRVIEQFEGAVKVTAEIETLVDDTHTYWCIKPANAMGWAAVTLESFPTYPDDTDNGYTTYFQQEDGFIKLDDANTTTLEFTLTADQVAELATPGEGDDGAPYGGFLFQTYGITVKSITMTDETAAADEVVDSGDVADDTVEAGDVVAPTTDDKGNADTGVEGVAVVAGLAVLAAAGVVVAKKRK